MALSEAREISRELAAWQMRLVGSETKLSG
jgi:hypothetical protein